MMQGAADSCDEPQSSQGLDRFFTGAYSRIVLNGVGHFPHREAPLEEAGAALGHLGIHDRRG
jgi:pimeloyl-ACP methyl ester carboxylesterase